LLVEELLAIDLRAVEVVHHQRVLHFEVNAPHELFDLAHDVNFEFLLLFLKVLRKVNEISCESPMKMKQQVNYDRENK
jgi:hypothetical protein